MIRDAFGAAAADAVTETTTHFEFFYAPSDFMRPIVEWTTPRTVRLACGHIETIDETTRQAAPDPDLLRHFCLQCLAHYRKSLQ
jgi:hypothetical protein